MYHISSDDYKNYFLSCLEQAMQILSDYGHVTHYKDLPDGINDKSIVLSQKMSDIEDKVIGLSIADSENYLYFTRWWIRLDIAGLRVDHEQICAECIPEVVWDSIEVFEFEDIISISRDYEEFNCDRCGKNRGGRFDPKLNLGSDE